jgi:putative sugar O-methyltransferase
MSGNWTPYLTACQNAVDDPWHFDHFRSNDGYKSIVELQDNGKKFARYIRKAGSAKILSQLSEFKKLDSIGSPKTHHYPSLGTFSATNLRYIAIANHIEQLFGLPEHATIAEIGAGFGGQCYTLSCVHPFSKYYIYDIPIVEALISKVLAHLKVQNFLCLPIEAHIEEEEIDLVISNYALSECSIATQLDYIQKVLAKSKRGYIIYNNISHIAGIQSLSLEEFIHQLEELGKTPRVLNELISTGEKNKLVVWD